jgi:hypothetical protein
MTSSGKNQSPTFLHMKRATENDTSNNSSIAACVFITAVAFLPSCCLAMVRGFLPSCYLATIGGFLPSRCLATIRENTQRQQRDLISLLLFFQNKEIRVITEYVIVTLPEPSAELTNSRATVCHEEHGPAIRSQSKVHVVDHGLKVLKMLRIIQSQELGL